jgi:EAL domain-containing protein (putative c-di-GMP-specific phosphodiesterase class I)
MTPSQGGETVVKRALQVIRQHLGMEVAYVSKFVDDRAMFTEVDAPGLEAVIKPGDSRSLDDIYCRHILAGRLPELMPDTAAVPLAASMPITGAQHIGKHISVPIRLRDGSPYGMFCCLGFNPDPSLQQRDLEMMRAFADLAAFEINHDIALKLEAEEKRHRIASTIDGRLLTMAFQPIWHLPSRRPLGVECPARFQSLPARSPDKWFREAAETGLGIELELTAVRMALAARASFPADTYLAVNVSPVTILSGELEDALGDFAPGQIVLEITEHASVANYSQLLDTLGPLRQRGLRLAVDDAGAGYSSLQHILHLQPDLIKLDMALVQGIDTDRARRALATALVRFAAETNSSIVAEGVETEAELTTLEALGVEKAQGYLLGRSVPLAEASKLFERDRANIIQI